MKPGKAFLIFILTLGSIAFSSCGGGHDEPTDEDIFLGKLAQTWSVTGGQVTVDGLDVTEDFEGMTITFGADKHYTTVHGVPPIWPAAGTFTIKAFGNNMYDITRDDGTQISILALSDKSITLTLQYTYSGARSSEVSGKYQFVMTR